MTQANQDDVRTVSAAGGVTSANAQKAADERAQIDDLYFGGTMSLKEHAERSLALLQAHQKSLDAALPAAMAVTRPSPATQTDDVHTLVQSYTPPSSSAATPANEGDRAPDGTSGKMGS